MSRKKKAEKIDDKPVKTVPMPTAEDNEALQKFDAAKAKKDAAAGGAQEPKKRHRRTRQELEQERMGDEGFEIFRDFIKMLSDNDSKKWDIPKQPKEVFEPLARQYSTIVNYFMPKGKPIYFVCAAAVFSTAMMLKERREIIDKKHPPEKKEPPKQTPPPRPAGAPPEKPASEFQQSHV